MVYYITNGELYHHGTKGMKWGRRLYQNKDGSLTALGRARVKRQKAKNLEKARQAKAEKVQQAKTTAEKKEEVLKSRSAKSLYENAHLFDDRELQTAYNRLVLERNIKSLSPAEVSKGEAFVNKAIKVGNKSSEALETGTRLYNNVARVMNAFTDSKLPLIKTDKGKDKKKDNDDDDNNNNNNNNSNNKKNKKSSESDSNGTDEKSNKKTKEDKQSFGEKLKSAYESNQKNAQSTVENMEKKSTEKKTTKTEKETIDLEYDPVTNMYGHRDDIAKSVNSYIDTLDNRTTNYGHYPEIVDSVNRYIDELDRL